MELMEELKANPEDCSYVDFNPKFGLVLSGNWVGKIEGKVNGFKKLEPTSLLEEGVFSSCLNWRPMVEVEDVCWCFSNPSLVNCVSFPLSKMEGCQVAENRAKPFGISLTIDWKIWDIKYKTLDFHELGSFGLNRIFKGSNR